MEKISKKLIIMLTCFVLVIGVMAVSALAADVVLDGKCGENATWMLTDDGTLSISGEGEMYDYDMEKSPWYTSRLAVCKIVIEDGITKIGVGAFEGCISLVDVTIPATVEWIGEEAFLNCSSLKEITIPAAVFIIGDRAFNGCTSMTAFHVDDECQNYSSDEKGFLFNKQKNRLVKVPATVSGVFYAPDKTSLAPGAFDSCYLITSVVFPEHVYFIDIGVFENCTGITEIILPENMEEIGDFAFSGCTSLKSINIPENVATIGLNPFRGCTSLEGIWVDKDNENYSNDENGVLYNKSKTELKSVPCTMTGTFNIARKVEVVDEHAFQGCVKLEGVSVDKNNSYFSVDENGVLYNKSKTTMLFAPNTLSGSYTVNESVTTIGGGAFSNCTEITEMILPEGLKNINSNAFENCTGLKNITIPANVSQMLPDIFKGCTKLTKIRFEGNMPSGMSNNFLRGVTAKVYYPADNSTWDHTAMKYFGGDVTWLAYPGKKGDVNEDTNITNSDLVMIARYIVGLYDAESEEAEIIADLGDVDGDGKVTNTDLVQLARIIVGIVE